jgi:hypothetical protein
VQTNVSSAPTGLLMFLAVAWLTLLGPLRDSPRLLRLPRLLLLFAGGALAGLLSAFAWYALRGGLHDFWWYWWSWSRDYADGTGLAGRAILDKGWNDFTVYYRARPFIPLVALLFLCDAIRRRRAGEPIWIDVLLLAWWVSECAVVALSQRFFPHYLVLPLVPVGVMAAVLAARWGTRVPRGAQLAAPVFLGFCALWFGGWSSFRDGLDRAEHFKSTAQTQADNVAAITPDKQEARMVIHTYVPGVVQAIVWTAEPWDYTDLDLRSAIRYVPRTWLTGEAPGAPTSENFVRAGAWDRFWADVRRTPPQAIVTHTGEPLPAGKPIGRLASCAFKTVWAGERWTLMLRNRKPLARCLPRA